jgi:hypothetical protein
MIPNIVARGAMTVALVAAVWISSYPAIADTKNADPRKQAVSLYNARKYHEALVLFEPLTRGALKSDPVAHYYLANTYSQLGRKNDALNEYRESLRLDPLGSAAAKCQAAIDSLTKSSVTATKTAPAEPKAVAPVETTAAAPVIDDSEVVSKLPKLPAPKKLQPALGDVQKWSDQERTNFLSEAQARVPQYEEDVRGAERLKQQADSVVRSLVPNSRAFGEAEQAFVARRNAAQERARQLVQPFEANMDKAVANLEQAKAIVEACQTSARGYNGWVPVGR